VFASTPATELGGGVAVSGMFVGIETGAGGSRGSSGSADAEPRVLPALTGSGRRARFGSRQCGQTHERDL
jgi:hypothetical protein